jgi:hypothetical protein
MTRQPLSPFEAYAVERGTHFICHHCDKLRSVAEREFTLHAPFAYCTACMVDSMRSFCIPEPLVKREDGYWE